MPNAAQPAAALRDRAERHVFAVAGELPAIERRVLALLELTGADRTLAARDAGLDSEALREAAARARKALRRTRAPLAAGGRCEQAELLLSDRLDGALDWREGRWLDIHLDRCPRCREHEALLDEAREELRASFSPVEPGAHAAEGGGSGEPEATTPPAPPTEERARLRVVPPPAEQPQEEPVAVQPPPAPVPAVRPAQPDRRVARRAAAMRAARVLAAVLVIAALIAAVVFGISRLGSGDDQQQAPWDGPDAPVVHPTPLSGQ